MAEKENLIKEIQSYQEQLKAANDQIEQLINENQKQLQEIQQIKPLETGQSTKTQQQSMERNSFSSSRDRAFSRRIINNSQQRVYQIETLKKFLLGNKEKQFNIQENLQSAYCKPSEWLYTIVFRNPDSLNQPQYINRIEASRIFMECFKGTSARTQQQQDANKILEKQAFLAAFDEIRERNKQQIIIDNAPVE